MPDVWRYISYRRKLLAISWTWTRTSYFLTLFFKECLRRALNQLSYQTRYIVHCNPIPNFQFASNRAYRKVKEWSFYVTNLSEYSSLDHHSIYTYTIQINRCSICSTLQLIRQLDANKDFEILFRYFEQSKIIWMRNDLASVLTNLCQILLIDFFSKMCVNLQIARIIIIIISLTFIFFHD